MARVVSRLSIVDSMRYVYTAAITNSLYLLTGSSRTPVLKLRSRLSTGAVLTRSSLIIYKGKLASSNSYLIDILHDYSTSSYVPYGTVFPNHILTIMQYAQQNIYLILEFCSGGDLANYIKKRGRVDTLQYIPSPGAPPQYYPHPKSGGLDITVVRSFLRQLGR